MSRFVEILNSHDEELSVQSFERMARAMVDKLETDSGDIEMSFPYFMRKTAPVSHIESLMDYEVTFIGEIRNGSYQLSMKVVVPVTSLCPCSKQVSAYGAHNQRSHMTISIRANSFIWIEDLIHMAEDQASCELYSVLKRSDEKYVTEKAYDNPKFVEDVVRDLAAMLNRDARIDAYVVESENFESIHNHSAYALIERNKLEEPS
jgi:GTP cyclohydrolase I